MFFFQSSSNWRDDDEGTAIGQVAPAVAVAVDVAVHVEQRLGPGDAVHAVLAAISRVVAVASGRDGTLRRDRLAAADAADLGLHVAGQADGAAQRDLVGRHPADDRIVHVEVVQRAVRVGKAIDLDAAPGQIGSQVTSGHGLVGELERHRH
jgi:hypothetical protein